MARRLAFRFRTADFPLEEVQSLLELVESADAIVATGGGFVTDSFSDHAKNIIKLLDAGRANGVPTAMFGQGLGPIEDRGLFEVARELAGFDLVSLREGRAGPLLLSKLGVPSNKWRVTGDDAIELAYRFRPEKLGGCLGVNLRLAYYSGMTPETARSVFAILKDVALSTQAAIIPLPISIYQVESDTTSILQLADISPQESLVAQEIDSPKAAAKQAGRCRVVVTGSYHAGVFALSQGCSVVGVAATPYYADKFLGLQHQFPDGCKTVTLDSSNGMELLRRAVMDQWSAAPENRHKLLARASSQIESSRAAYQDWCGSVLQRVPARTTKGI
jgi:colanic acid/amylovoran biosynthesis protein